MEHGMTDAEPRLPRRRFARGQSRPAYLQPTDVDAVMMMLVALMSEVSALRDRIDTHEALAEAGTVGTRDAIDAYKIDRDRHAEREMEREKMLKRVLRVITEERDAAVVDCPAKPAPGA